MSRKVTDQGEVLPGLLGQAVTDVAVDDALIRQDRWAEVDLSSLAADRQGRRPTIGARLGSFPGAAASVEGAASEEAPRTARQALVAAEDRRFVGNIEPRRLARVTRVAAVADLVEPPSPPQPARKALNPPRVTPMPAPRGIAWQSRPALDSSAILANKKNSKSLIVLFISLWTAIVAVGVYKSVTPPSGYDLRWGD